MIAASRLLQQEKVPYVIYFPNYRIHIWYVHCNLLLTQFTYKKEKKFFFSVLLVWLRVSPSLYWWMSETYLEQERNIFFSLGFIYIIYIHTYENIQWFLFSVVQYVICKRKQFRWFWSLKNHNKKKDEDDDEECRVLNTKFFSRETIYFSRLENFRKQLKWTTRFPVFRPFATTEYCFVL